MEMMKEFESVKELKEAFANKLGVPAELLNGPEWTLSGYLTDAEKELFKNYAPDVLKYHGAYQVQYYYNFGYVVTDLRDLK